MTKWIAIPALLLLSACANPFAEKAQAPPPVSAPPVSLASECDLGGGGSAREWNCTADSLNDEGLVRAAQRAYRRSLGSMGADDRQRAYALGGLAVTSAQLGDCQEAESAVEELRSFAPRNPLARTSPPICESLRRLSGD